jgi:hypothetical protein
LSLPTDCTNEYRYRYVGEPRHVSAALHSSLATLASGTECIVCFIDRFGATGYEYHPLRRGTYLSSREANDYVYFLIRLGSFLYPRNVGAFKGQILQALSASGLPQLTDANPESTRDGFYAILGESIFGQNDECFQDDRAWSEAVESLSKTRGFISNNSQSPVFTRVDVQERSSGQRINALVQSSSSKCRFEKDKAYQLSVTYRFPRQRQDQTAHARAEVQLGDNLKPLAGTTIQIDSHANSVLVPFRCKRYAEEDSGNILFAPVNEHGKPELVISGQSIEFQIHESLGFWVQAIMALLIFSLAAAFIGVDLSKLSSLSACAIWHAAWPKIIAGIFQTAALFWIFRLLGKKPI